MDSEKNIEETSTVIEEKHPVFQVTKTSKYFALLLFVLLPFIGGWIGYQYAPDKVKVVEIERIVISEEAFDAVLEKEMDTEFAQKNSQTTKDFGIAGGTTLSNGRYLLNTSSDLLTFQVIDLLRREVIFEDDVSDTGSLNSSVCHIGYPNAATNFNFSKDGAVAFYGIYSGEKINDCEFKLLETREYQITFEAGAFSIQQDEGEGELKLIDLAGKVLRTIDTDTLTFLGTEKQVGWSFTYQPSPNGSHVFVDGSDECGGCEVQNEAIVTWKNGIPVIIPLPNIRALDWIDDDVYTYKEVIISPEICEGVTGRVCLPYTYSEEKKGQGQ